MARSILYRVINSSCLKETLSSKTFPIPIELLKLVNGSIQQTKKITRKHPLRGCILAPSERLSDLATQRAILHPQSEIIY